MGSKWVLLPHCQHCTALRGCKTNKQKVKLKLIQNVEIWGLSAYLRYWHWTGMTAPSWRSTPSGDGRGEYTITFEYTRESSVTWEDKLNTTCVCEPFTSGLQESLSGSLFFESCQAGSLLVLKWQAKLEDDHQKAGLWPVKTHFFNRIPICKRSSDSMLTYRQFGSTISEISKYGQLWFSGLHGSTWCCRHFVEQWWGTQPQLLSIDWKPRRKQVYVHHDLHRIFMAVHRHGFLTPLWNGVVYFRWTLRNRGLILTAQQLLACQRPFLLECTRRHAKITFSEQGRQKKDSNTPC